ncbi:cysteine-rich secretory protein 1 [Trichonephila inaurata madagascariensis]|uniref:Cysteine-rich secretory protein 1 n=1 Tax=Trichonephila inaurata madagascariensis TaxID=2747483 RepID=A0A8X7CQF4_9ARAC|nr:cysteine-rich secretory protein 1 [Trichonephila inaurata madagascariensis]
MSKLLFYNCIFLILHISSSYPKLSRPKLYGNAIPPEQLDPTNNATKRKILLAHNFFRARVDPPASDMLEVSWHDEAAEDAQRWSEACQLLLHDNATGRWTEDFGSCGQNIFVANVQVPWFFAAKVWFLEKLNFTYGEDLNDPNVVGHYTQKSKNLFVKRGNHPERFDRPYTNGTSCSDCDGHCKFNKLCTNGCPYADYWTNCNELNSTWNNWLCDDETTDRYQACRSTCRCDGKIR